MAMKIYGATMSRASRVLWCANESGCTVRICRCAWENQKKPEFLAVNPCGKFPGFADGDLKLFELLAINLYIAKKYGTGELYPTTSRTKRGPSSGRYGLRPRSSPMRFPR